MACEYARKLGNATPRRVPVPPKIEKSINQIVSLRRLVSQDLPTLY